MNTSGVLSVFLCFFNIMGNNPNISVLVFANTCALLFFHRKNVYGNRKRRDDKFTVSVSPLFVRVCVCV